MKALMSSWWREFSFYSFWEEYREPDWDEEDRNKPLVSFSAELWTLETRPNNYNAKNDTGRWRSKHLRVYLSRYLIGLTVPYWPLPDHVPTERQLKRRQEWIDSGRQKKMDDLIESLNGTKKL